MKSTLGRLRLLASLTFAISVVLGVLGITALVPDPGLEGDVLFWIPAAVAVLGLVGVKHVVDPLLIPKRDMSPGRVSKMVNSMMGARLLAAVTPTVAGLAVGLAAQSDPSVLVGSGASVVMLSHWWPGRQFENVVRAKLLPVGGAELAGRVLRPL
ncbi:hypothetical protein ABT390_05785 [Streptomyces aurantiacus]|uniref:hypothetical protein n=1 Tax=Streptomyces aurantiacus TaxID=47760 RepID=UPI003331FDDF